MRLKQALNTEDLCKLAKARLPKIAYDVIESGVHDEALLVVNRASFRRYAILPRYLVDVSKRDQSVTLFGKTYASPIGIAPMGIGSFFRRGADMMLAAAAAEANVPYVMSSVSSASIEMATKTAPANAWFQIYGTRTPAITDDLVRRATDAGVNALIFTVDTPIVGGRERNARNGFSRPVRFTPSMIVQGMLHPAWSLDYIRNGGTPMMQNWQPYVPNGTADQVADLYGKETPTPGQTWGVLERIRRNWKGPLLVKGILHPKDAAKCVELGADGIVISNHGARQFDSAPAPLEVLPLIRAEVGEKFVLGIDSGIRRGSDLVIAKCLGADFGLIGRPAMYGVVAGGKAGAARALDILRKEIDHTMAQAGCPSFAEFNREMLLDVATSRSVRSAPQLP